MKSLGVVVLYIYMCSMLAYALVEVGKKHYMNESELVDAGSILNALTCDVNLVDSAVYWVSNVTLLTDVPSEILSSQFIPPQCENQKYYTDLVKKLRVYDSKMSSSLQQVFTNYENIIEYLDYAKNMSIFIDENGLDISRPSLLPLEGSCDGELEPLSYSQLYASLEKNCIDRNSYLTRFFSPKHRRRRSIFSVVVRIIRTLGKSGLTASGIKRSLTYYSVRYMNKRTARQVGKYTMWLFALETVATAANAYSRYKKMNVECLTEFQRSEYCNVIEKIRTTYAAYNTTMYNCQLNYGIYEADFK